jgi:hypothetical protein
LGRKAPKTVFSGLNLDIDTIDAGGVIRGVTAAFWLDAVPLAVDV